MPCDEQNPHLQAVVQASGAAAVSSSSSTGREEEAAAAQAAEAAVPSAATIAPARRCKAQVSNGVKASDAKRPPAELRSGT